MRRGGVVASRELWEQTKSKMALGLTVFLLLIWFCSSVCLYIWNFPIVSTNLPFLVVCGISMISVIGPMECLWSSRCVVKLDFRILYL
jgi:hypothetical protein